MLVVVGPPLIFKPLQKFLFFGPSLLLWLGWHSWYWCLHSWQCCTPGGTFFVEVQEPQMAELLALHLWGSARWQTCSCTCKPGDLPLSLTPHPHHKSSFIAKRMSLGHTQWCSGETPRSILRKLYGIRDQTGVGHRQGLPILSLYYLCLYCTICIISLYCLSDCTVSIVSLWLF